MDEQIIEILRKYDNLVLDITEITMLVRVNDGPFRVATELDRLEFLREEWFKVTEKLNELGYEIPTN